MAPASNYDPLCDVIAEWYEMHKQLTRDGTKIDGVRTPPAARHRYLYAAGIFDPAQRDGQAIGDDFSYIRQSGLAGPVSRWQRRRRHRRARRCLAHGSAARVAARFPREVPAPVDR
jgi:hypothetical protein